MELLLILVFVACILYPSSGGSHGMGLGEGIAILLAGVIGLVLYGGIVLAGAWLFYTLAALVGLSTSANIFPMAAFFFGVVLLGCCTWTAAILIDYFKNRQVT